jgi:PAB1-binding protein PBP1
LKDFAKVYDVKPNNPMIMESSINSSVDDLAKLVSEAILQEDAEKVTDLKEFAKTSKTVQMDPSRF